MAMKVLQLISSSGYYGAEAMMVTLATALRETEVDARIALLRTPSPGCLDVARRAEEQGLPVHLIPCGGKWDSAAIEEIRRIVRDCAIEIVHGHGYKSDLYGYLATRKAAAKCVATCHDSGLANRLRLSNAGTMEIYGWLHKRVLRRLDAVATVSQPIADALVRSGVQSHRVSVIENGISLTRFRSAKPAPDLLAFKGTAPLIGLVARLAEGKGHAVLLEAARCLIAQEPALKFIFVGDGPLEAEMRRLTCDLGLTSCVQFAGKRADMPAVYAALDVMVLPSRNEGMPITVLEAMASKTPVIATTVGAIPQLISNRRTGLLISPDDVGSLRHAISELVSAPRLSATIAQAALDFVQARFSAATMANKYLELYAKAGVQAMQAALSISPVPEGSAHE